MFRSLRVFYHETVLPASKKMDINNAAPPETRGAVFRQPAPATLMLRSRTA